MSFNRTDVVRLAVAVALALGLPLAAGVVADTWQGSSPVWTVVGVVAGSLFGMILACRRIGRNLSAFGDDDPDE